MIMIFEKRQGKADNANWQWKGERVESVGEVVYMGIYLQRNRYLTNHLKEKTKRANVTTRQVWRIGER